MRNLQQIADELLALRRLKRQLPRLCPAGGDAVVGIDAQIETLSGRLTTDDIALRNWSHFERQSALDARAWLVKETDAAPSDAWLPQEREEQSEALRAAIADGRLLS